MIIFSFSETSRFRITMRSITYILENPRGGFLMRGTDMWPPAGQICPFSSMFHQQFDNVLVQNRNLSPTFRLTGLKLTVDVHGPLRMSSTDYLVIYGQWPKPSYTENVPIRLGYTFFLAFSSYWCANI